MAYKLQKPYTQEERNDFIVTYNHQQGLNIEETEEAIFALEPWEKLIDGEVVDNTEEYEAEQARKEQERIQELSMTRSDFFDGTIKAFGAGQEELLLAVEAVLKGLKIAEVDKKIALNNYKNALNFYRKHPLFTMLSDVEIPIGEGVSITISSEQWDKFFDETVKGNPNAYKELLPKEEVENEDTTDNRGK